MVSVAFLFLSLSLLFPTALAEPTVSWEMAYDSSGDDEFYALLIDDCYVLAGITNSSGFGHYDVWLIKTDSNGKMKWNRTYGGLYNDAAFTAIKTIDGGYALAGSTNSAGTRQSDIWQGTNRTDVLLVKVDSSGNMLWNQTYGGQSTDQCWSMVASDDGGYLLLCLTRSFGAGEEDVWLVKVNSAGDMEWSRTYGGSRAESVSTIVKANDGGYVLACSTISFGAGSSDVWLIKVDSSGNMLWNQTYGGSGVEYPNSLAATNDGGYVFAGSTSSTGAGSADVWLVKVDASGSMQWSQTYGGEIADYCESVVVTANGGYALACITQKPTFGDGEFWLINTDSVGNLVWNHTIANSAFHSSASLLTDSDGSLVFGGTTRDSLGKRDFLLVKISQTGTEVDYTVYLYIAVVIVFAILAIAGFSYKRKKTKRQT